MDEKERYEKGLQTRREVLGNEHVQRAEAKLNEFNGPFQEFITRYAWGEIWQRPGLTRRERSLITLAMLVALNREPEFRMHIRAAFNNGVTEEEIRELLIHAGIYCGLPAANAAIHVAEEVIMAARTGRQDKT
jgi:4-carboxymuconolactone decarboxylase